MVLGAVAFLVIVITVVLLDDWPRRVRRFLVSGDRVVYGRSELRNQHGMGVTGALVVLLFVAAVMWGLYEVVQWLAHPIG